MKVTIRIFAVGTLAVIGWNRVAVHAGVNSDEMQHNNGQKTISQNTTGHKVKQEVRYTPQWVSSGAVVNQGWDKDACDAQLEWKRTPSQYSSDPLAYNIYRREAISTERTLIATVKDEENRYREYAGTKKHYKASKKVFYYSLKSVYLRNKDFVESDFSEERAIACWYWKLGNSNDQELVNIQNRALNSDRAYLKRAALVAMEIEKAEAVFIDEARDAIKSSEKDVRWITLIALSSIGGDEAKEVLKIATESKDSEFSEAARILMDRIKASQ
jgi:hypothetical protein